MRRPRHRNAEATAAAASEAEGKGEGLGFAELVSGYELRRGYVEYSPIGAEGEGLAPPSRPFPPGMRPSGSKCSHPDRLIHLFQAGLLM